MINLIPHRLIKMNRNETKQLKNHLIYSTFSSPHFTTAQKMRTRGNLNAVKNLILKKILQLKNITNLFHSSTLYCSSYCCVSVDIF